MRIVSAVSMLPYVGRFLGMRLNRNSMDRGSLLQKFLMRVALALALTVVSGFMFGVLLIGAFCASYFGLISAGLAPHVALGLLSGIAFIITCLLAAGTIFCLRQLKPQDLMRQEIPILSKAEGIVGAFAEGLLARRARW